MLVQSWKDSLAEFNSALQTNSKPKTLGEVLKLNFPIKFGDFTIEIKSETYQHQELSEIIIMKLWILD